MVNISYSGLVLKNIKVEKTIAKAANAAFAFKGIKDFEVDVRLTGDNAIRRINTAYRHINKSTDVLSFPSTDDFIGDQGFFGDIAIALPTARRQARAFNQSFLREITFLTIHGCLHLLGYDHLNKTDEDKMREAQRAVLQTIKES